MAQYSVYENGTGAGWLLDVQSDLLQDTATRVVVPLLPRRQAPRPARRLNPIFYIEDREVVMMTLQLAAVPISILQDEVDGKLIVIDDVTAALDMLFHGF